MWCLALQYCIANTRIHISWSDVLIFIVKKLYFSYMGFCKIQEESPFLLMSTFFWSSAPSVNVVFGLLDASLIRILLVCFERLGERPFSVWSSTFILIMNLMEPCGMFGGSLRLFVLRLDLNFSVRLSLTCMENSLIFVSCSVEQRMQCDHWTLRLAALF